MTKATEDIFEQLINEAWFQYDAAILANDKDGAEHWKREAFDLLSQLPENMVYLKDMQ